MSEIEKGKIKAKRKIKALDFSGANAAVALVSKDQGGPANGVETLIIKAQNFSDEFLEKMQTVRVEMQIPEFIEAFFKLEEEDAKALAYLMGWREDMQEELVESDEEFQDWISSNMESFEIIKAMKDSDYTKVLSDLSEDQYFALLKDQEKFEKELKKYNIEKQEAIEKAKAAKSKPRLKRKESTEVAKSTEGDKPQIASEVMDEVKLPQVNKSKSKETLMTQEVKVVEQTLEVEMVEKAAFEQIQKQAAETQELLKAAMQELEVFKAEKAAMIAKARKQAVTDAVKSEEKAEVLFKSIQGLADEQFNAVVSVVKSLAEQVEKSALFQETGATVDTAVSAEAESAVAKILKSQFAK